MQVWNVLHAARWKYRTEKSRQKSPFWHHRTTLSGYIFGTKARIDNRKKNLLSSNAFSIYPDTVNFGLLTAEICWRVWGIPANFNGFHILAALLHGTLVVGISQTLWRWTEGATYIRHGGHVGLWPTFLVLFCFLLMKVMISLMWQNKLCTWTELIINNCDRMREESVNVHMQRSKRKMRRYDKQIVSLLLSILVV